MKCRIIGFAAAATLAVGAPAMAQEKAAHRHIGHVLEEWGDTPDQQGLLPTAQAEAAVAAQHAALALSDTTNLGSIQVHTRHVLHAVDPALAAGGPGKGYGLIKAAHGVATHVGLAAGTDDASNNVKLHATHVRSSAENVVQWAERIVELGKQIQDAGSATDAAGLAREIQTLTGAISNGRDANGDGRTSWERGEGGLEQAAFHMGLMTRGEGIS